MNIKPIRVLVVEDDLHLLNGIRDILELDDYHVLTAMNGQEALTVLRSDPYNPPDVIVSDVMMPKMNGFKFLEEVRNEKLWLNVPFIFLTAKGEQTDRHKGSMLGADRYLTKPFDAPDLQVAVSATLKRHRIIKDAHDEEIESNKNKILTILNHEFRTPLTLVVAYAEMLKEFDPHTAPPDEIQTFLRGVNSGADRLRRMIENFITVVELDNEEAKKTIAWRKRPVHDFDVILKDALRFVENDAQNPSEFVTHIQEDMPAVECDVQYVTTMLRELLSNAAKFSEDGDVVTTDVRVEGEELIIKVTDTGRGIPENELENIWGRFYQIDREQHEDQGSGSGLAIVAGIVKLHGGSYSVDSTVGEGSTFTVRLPLKVPAPMPDETVVAAN
ncbi:MAG: response regulator [Chloroflexota bacterium]